jgi:hypothetical protein
VEVDPALCVNEKAARSLEECVKHIEREVTVFVASSYPATPLQSPHTEKLAFPPDPQRFLLEGRLLLHEL